MIRDSAVLAFLVLAPQLAMTQGRPALSGVVYDSVGRRPLAGAMVQVTGAAGTVIGRTASAVTDTTGRYAVAVLAPGRYVAGFFHDALDTLGLVGEPRAADVGDVRPWRRTPRRTVLFTHSEVHRVFLSRDSAQFSGFFSSRYTIR